MARILIAPSKSAWFPGDTLQAHVQVAYARTPVNQPAIRLQDLCVEIAGVEQVDPNWVSSSFHAEFPIQAKQTRRLLRDIFRSSAAISSAIVLLPGEKASYVVKCVLPEVLPPSFRGTSVRYTYHLRVSCRQSGAPMPADDEDCGQLESVRGESPGSAAANTRLGFRRRSSHELAHVASADSLGHSGRSKGGDSDAAAAAVAARWPEPGDGGSKSEGGKPLVATVDLPVWPRSADPSANGASGPIDSGVTATPFIRYSLLAPDESPVIEVQSFMVTSSSRNEVSAQQSYHQGRSAILWAANRSDLPPGSSGPPSNNALAGRSNGFSEDSFSGDLALPPRPLPPLVVVDRSALSRYATSDAGTDVGTPSIQRRVTEAGSSSSRTRSVLPTPQALLKTYNLKFNGHDMVRVEVHPPRDGSLRLGVTFTGTLDFSPPPNAEASHLVNCHQVVIHLETEEIISREWLLPSHRKANRCIVRQLFAEVLEVTQDQLFTSFMFTIPRFASPCFQTQLVALQWVLRFEFSASTGVADPWRKPEEVVWALPLAVLAPPPASSN